MYTFEHDCTDHWGGGSLAGEEQTKKAFFNYTFAFALWNRDVINAAKREKECVLATMLTSMLR